MRNVNGRGMPVQICKGVGIPQFGLALALEAVPVPWLVELVFRVLAPGCSM